MHQVQVIQLVHGGFSGQDIHGFAGQEMQDAAFDLGGTAGGIGAEPAGFAFRLYQRCATVRANRREYGCLRTGTPLGRLYSRDFGDDFSSFFHIDPVTLVDIQGADLVLIHQRGAFDHGTAQQNGFQIGHGCHGAGATHLVVDAQDGRTGLLGLEFIGYGPAGTLGSKAQLPLDGHLVDLNDNAVGGIGKVLAGGIPMADEFLDFGYIMANAPMLAHGKTPALGSLEGVVVGRVVHLTGRDVVQGAE